MFVNRMISFWYDPEQVRFETDEQLEAFQKALGRMVMFGMTSDKPRDIEWVDLGLNREHEITGAYYPSWMRGEGYKANEPQYQLDNTAAAFLKGTPFVMGGVPRDGGIRYSFHS